MVFIYKLEYEGLVLYVGKTVDMKGRYYRHCTRKDKSGSREIPADMIWSMILLEECEDVVGTSREQYFYDILKPLYNKRRPGQTPLEWHHTHPEKRREHSRRYYTANREACNAKNREQMCRYRAANRDAINARQREIARAKRQSNAVPANPPQEEVASSAPLSTQQH